MTQERYEALAGPLRRRPRLLAALKLGNRALTGLCYVLYPLLLFLLYRAEDGRLLRCVLVPAVSFALLSVFRHVVNAPRPYELGIDPLFGKKRCGHSFPSRHVFSVFVIAMTWGYIVPWMGGALMIAGALLAALRVVGGVHFPRDVFAGALTGVAAGGIGFYLI